MERLGCLLCPNVHISSVTGSLFMENIAFSRPLKIQITKIMGSLMMLLSWKRLYLSSTNKRITQCIVCSQSLYWIKLSSWMPRFYVIPTKFRLVVFTETPNHFTGGHCKKWSTKSGPKKLVKQWKIHCLMNNVERQKRTNINLLCLMEEKNLLKSLQQKSLIQNLLIFHSGLSDRMEGAI